MHTLGRSVWWVSLVVVSHWGGHKCLGAADVEEADELVQQALKSELAGNPIERSVKLEAAVSEFPEHAPARWHSGQLQIASAWLNVEDAERRTAEQGVTGAYRRQRTLQAHTVDGQAALALWCRRNRLADQERLHWAVVLQLDPNHREARTRLAVREYRGRLLTREAIAACEERRKAEDQALKHWRPRLTKLRDALRRSDLAVREKALDELRAIDDEAAIPALEQVLSPSSELAGLEVVRIVGRLPGQAAVDALVRHALQSEHETVREAAALQLRSRSWFSYVPMLLGELQAPIELSYFAQQFPGGIQYGYEAVQDHPGGTYGQTHRHSILGTTASDGPFRRSRSWERYLIPPPTAEAYSTYERDSSQLIALREQTSDVNLRHAASNSRILSALRTATLQQLSNDPRDWWQWWADQNELEQRRHVQIEQVATAQTLITWLSERPRPPVGWFTPSCFLRGTSVWTDTGELPIEDVRVGDRVLSQDQATGELAYKLVMHTTLRTASPTLRLRLGDEELVATLGHPFWVTGQGWRMAKEIKSGDLLHGVHGSVPIDSIEPGPEAEAYNLVVADFNTYCVGKHRTLVHDNQARLASEAVLPGLKAE